MLFSLTGNYVNLKNMDGKRIKHYVFLLILFLVFVPGKAIAQTILPGDANEDGIVNGADFSIWLNNYSKIIPTPVTNSHRNGDFNSDGVVNGADFSIWLSHYGQRINTTPTPTLPATASFNFISWSDTELSLTTFAQLSNQALALQPELTIYNGDAEAGTLSQWQTALNGNNNNGMSNKTFVVRGNGNSGIGVAAWQSFFEFSSVASAIGATNYTALTPDIAYSFDYGNSRFIGIDVPGCISGPVSADQNTWINARLTDAESRGLTHAFLFFHQPIYAVNQHPCAIPGNLITTFNNHPIVTATFHGHEHVKAIVQFGPGAPVANRIPGVVNKWYEFVTAPAGGGSYNCTAGASDYCERYEGFANITVSGRNVTVNFYDTANALRKSITFTK